jgi:hypothetical protein
MVVLIGAEPHTEWLAGAVALDEDGFVLTGPALSPDLRHRARWERLGRGPFLVETSRPGVFAVGDVRSGSTKMVAPAVGEGAWLSASRPSISLALPNRAGASPRRRGPGQQLTHPRRPSWNAELGTARFGAAECARGQFVYCSSKLIHGLVSQLGFVGSNAPM